MPSVRIGIDVGGTFTDAVAIDSESMELLAQTKVPTTHNAENGVAGGIVDAASAVLQELDAGADDVVFIAHGTTQATNALLEGDVVKVGIIGMGKGLKGRRARSETQIDDIELGDGRSIETEHAFVSIDDGVPTGETDDILARFKQSGVDAVVASQAFGVDDPKAEERVCQLAREQDFAAVGANLVSKRYGLRVRTRTAVINASILPKMVETSRMTREGISEMGIDCPLMIMRSDGGVMNIEEMSRRPIQTILSGPAAGVAGALMYENVTDGIFIEVGGTSSDISVIENGKPKWKSAEIGDHKTFLRTLDIRTEGIAGGSLARVEDGEIVEVGPRSAHIADLDYSAYASADDITDPELVRTRPKEGDAEYVAIETSDGQRYALTPSCAANLLGLMPEGAYAAGNPDAVRNAFEPLATELRTDVEGAAEQLLRASAWKIKPVIESIIEEYDINEDLLEIVGGGGGSAALVSYLSEFDEYDTRLATNHEIISTVGVGLAMVRDVVERTVMDPTEGDIRKIRREAIDSVVGMGANADTVETEVEFDNSKNLLRATAEGSTELQTRDVSKESIDASERRSKASLSLDVDSSDLDVAGETNGLTVFQTSESQSRFFGLLSKTVHYGCVVDQTGVVRLTLENASVTQATGEELEQRVLDVLDRESIYGEGGTKLPSMYILYGSQILDLTGLSDREQMLSLIDIELEDISPEMVTVILAQKP